VIKGERLPIEARPTEVAGFGKADLDKARVASKACTHEATFSAEPGVAELG
jgi:hypothetical protein